MTATQRWAVSLTAVDRRQVI